MPIPTPNKNEKKENYLSRCISAIVDEYGQTQAAAICYSQWRKYKKELEMPVVTFKSYPKASPNTPWSFSADDGNRLIDKGGYKAYVAAHTIITEEITEENFNVSSCKLPHHKFVSGATKTVLRGVIATKNILRGAKGGSNLILSDEAKVEAEKHLNKHLKEFNRDDLIKTYKALYLETYVTKDIICREYCEEMIKKLEGNKDLNWIEE